MNYKQKRKFQRFLLIWILRFSAVVVTLSVIWIGITAYRYITQPVLVIRKHVVFEYQESLDESALLKRLIRNYVSVYDDLEYDPLLLDQVNDEAQPYHELEITAIRNNKEKTYQLTYQVLDTQYPEFNTQLTDYEFDMSESSWTNFNLSRELKTTDPTEGDIDITYQFTIEDNVIRASNPQLSYVLDQAGTYTIEAIAEDAHKNATSQTFQLTLTNNLQVDRNATIQGYTLQSKNTLVIDVDGNIFFQKNRFERMYPASLTKILTTMTVIDLIERGVETKNIAGVIEGSYRSCPQLIEELERPLCYDTLYRLPREVDEFYSYVASNVGYRTGDIVSVEDLLYGTMVTSGADATMALSVLLMGSEQGLVDAMNALAKRIGMNDSHFVTSSGLHHDDHYSTADDIAKLLQFAWANDTFKQVYGAISYIGTPTDTYKYGPYMVSYSRTIFSKLEFDEILGAKSGFTLESGRSLASVVKVDDTDYIVIVSMAPNDNTGQNVVYETVKIVEGILK